MNDKLIIRQKRDTYQAAVVVKVSPEAFAMVEDLCRRTGRSRTDIASRLIEWASERVEVRSDDED